MQVSWGRSMRAGGSELRDKFDVLDIEGPVPRVVNLHQRETAKVTYSLLLRSVDPKAILEVIIL